MHICVALIILCVLHYWAFSWMYWVGKWVPASAGKAKAGMVYSISEWMRGVQVKLWDPLRKHAIPERLRGVLTMSRYTNSRLPLPFTFTFTFHVYLYLYLLTILWCMARVTSDAIPLPPQTIMALDWYQIILSYDRCLYVKSLPKIFSTLVFTCSLLMMGRRGWIFCVAFCLLHFYNTWYGTRCYNVARTSRTVS